MDFDDLDDVIAERLETGEGLSGAAALAAGGHVLKPNTYKPTSYMPDMPRSARLPGIDELPETLRKYLRGKEQEIDRKICIRVFLFYGPGQSWADWAELASAAPTWMELVAHEWPGHGCRADEEPCTSLDDLRDDAYKAVKAVLERHAEGKPLEGAPFAFVGQSLGASVMTLVAYKLKWDYALEPSAVVVIDGAPPHQPLLSEHGKEQLAADPQEFMRVYSPQVHAQAWASAKGAKAFKALAADLQLGAESRDVGYHSFECDVLVFRAAQNSAVDEHAKAAKDLAETVLRIEGSEETLRFPVRASTKVSEVKAMLAKVVGTPASDLVFTVPSGTQQKEQKDTEVVGAEVTVKGLQAFKAARHVWPHPVAIIGCGYNGIKTAMEYLRTGNSNIMLFDRNDQVGGYCWITAANKNSKIQTEFGSFHVWFGPEYAESELCGGWPTDWDFHAGKQKVLEHFQYAVEQYGVLPHCCLQTNVSAMEIMGGKDKHERFYKLTVESLKGEKGYTTKCSVMYNYPGSMCFNRRIEYPGEDTFDGQIGYGMGDEYTYDERMLGSRVAILGNGAFAVENIRTCCEFGAAKVYLVTRRKNLPSPRVPCWFVHQGPFPTPGRLVLKMFEPMYELTGMGDPWKYWSVHADKTRWNVTIIQASRFGIGDVTFLAKAYGILEYVEDTVKRFTQHTVHLDGGGKLEEVTGVIKSLGLLGDFAVDKLHHMKEMVGMWCGGDFRRVLSIDATGMNAANFTTFSLGIAVHGGVLSNKYLHDYPQEYYRIHELGVLNVLAKSKADDSLQKPAYVTDVKYSMSCGITVSAMCPNMDRQASEDGWYKYALYHKCHPTDKFLEYCVADWDKYQKMFKEQQGIDREYIHYPYTKEVVKGFFDEWSQQLGVPISADGPGAEDVQGMQHRVKQAFWECNQLVLNNAVKATLHPSLKPPMDADALLELKKTHAARGKITASAVGSAVDYDPKIFEQWSQWTQGTCTVEDVDADSNGIRSSPKVWEALHACVKKVKAPPPS